MPVLTLRTDPVVMAAQAVDRLQDVDERDMINQNLIDFANIRLNQQLTTDSKRFKTLAHKCIIEDSSSQLIAKENWNNLKLRNANLDEGTFLDEINLQTAEDSPIEKILECAKNGTWVLICPIQFPQYF